MPRGIPANIIKKLYQKNVDSAFLTIITAYTNNSTIRMVNNSEPIEYKGEEYQATSFTIVLPDDQPDSVPVSSVVFADMDNTFLELIDGIDELECDVEVIAVRTDGEIYLYQGMADSDKITADSTVYTADRTLFLDDYPIDQPKRYGNTRTFTVYETQVGPYEMTLSNASGDVATTSFTISYDDVKQYSFPYKKFDSYDFPNLY